MPGSPAFTGSRLEFLQSHTSAFAQAVASQSAGDFQVNFFRRYFKRYPVTLPHDQEPSAADLAAVDDAAMDVEEDLSELEADEIEQQRHDILYRKSVSPFHLNSNICSSDVSKFPAGLSINIAKQTPILVHLAPALNCEPYSNPFLNVCWEFPASRQERSQLSIFSLEKTTLPWNLRQPRQFAESLTRSI